MTTSDDRSAGRPRLVLYHGRARGRFERTMRVYERWTAEEDEKLRSLYQTTGYEEIAALFNRPAETVWRHARQLGLRKYAVGNNEDRFWSRVNKNGPTMPDMESQCWVWTGRCYAGGRLLPYGLFDADGKTLAAHRYAYWLASGDLPVDKPCVLHRCDNPPCVRFDHLFPGTQADNIADCNAKGRHKALPGEKNGRHKLHAIDIPIILIRLRNGDAPTDIAREFDVWPGTIRHIASGKSWKDIQRAEP